MKSYSKVLEVFNLDNFRSSEIAVLRVQDIRSVAVRRKGANVLLKHGPLPYCFNPLKL